MRTPPRHRDSLIVGTFRTTELEPGGALSVAVADLNGAGATGIELQGVSEDDVVDMSVMMAGESGAIDVSVVRAVAHDTAGNPFFVGEVLRETVLRTGNADDPSALRVPSSVRPVIAQRIARLGEPARNLLSIASVIGRKSTLDLLATAAGIDSDTVLATVEVAIGAALVEEIPSHVDRFGFAHTLVQRTLYEGLGRPVAVESTASWRRHSRMPRRLRPNGSVSWRHTG